MSKSRRVLYPRVLLIATLTLATVSGAWASSFTVTSGTNTTAQTLGTSQTGSVSLGATLTNSGTTAIPVTMNGTGAALTNLGTISQTATGGTAGRAVFVSGTVAGVIITNGSATNSTAKIQTADSDVVRGSTNTAVTLNNYGVLTSLNGSKGGSQAVDFNPVTVANVINNFSTGQLLASDADVVRPGVNGTVNNNGLISINQNSSTGNDGIDVQQNTGVTINNTGSSSVTASIVGGRHGIAGGITAAGSASTAFTTTVNNNAYGVIQGNNGSGINLDGLTKFQGATIINNGTITGFGVTGDGDGIDVDGLVNIVNTGTVLSYNAIGTALATAHSEGITVGGGTIENSGTIKGLVSSGNAFAVGYGITLLGNDVATGPLAGTREAIYGNATVINHSGGLIQGQSESAIFVDGPVSGFVVSIINEASATLTGGGSSSAAVLTGADNDTLSNAGIINGGSSGVAINMGAGNNTVSISGGSATVNGDINGGSGGTNTLNMLLGAGNSFSFGNGLINFSLVEVYSGLVTLSGSSTYTGTTQIDGGILQLNGSNRLSSSSSLKLNGGTLEIENAGGANGQTFGCLQLSDNSTLALDSSSLSFGCLGALGAGKTLSIQGYSEGVSPAYAIRFAGDLSANSSFLALIGNTTVNGNAAVFNFDGFFTDVVAAPEPSTLGLGCLCLLLVPVLRRRGLGRK